MEEWVSFIVVMLIIIFIINKLDGWAEESDAIRHEIKDGFKYTYRGSKLISKRKIK